jgi:hypothetical protein
MKTSPANLSRGLGEEAAIMLDPWVAGIGGVFGVCSPPPFTGSAADENLACRRLPDRDRDWGGQGSP